MAVNVVINGVSYSIPEPGDTAWGQGLTNYFVAIASGLLQKSGGAFTLTAEVDFGATYGLKSAYFKSRGTNPAAAGQVRLANAESVSWRNQANSADLALSVNASNLLTFNGTAIQSTLSVLDTATIDLTLSSNTLSADVINASITNAKLATMATQTFKGRTTAGTGAPEDLTATQATAILNAMVGDSGSGGTKGLVPAPGAGDAAKVLSGAGTWITAAGTVTSVAMTVPTALFAASPVPGSPVTASGTLAPTLATQSANAVFAGPTSGSAATPTFRALTSSDQTIQTGSAASALNLGLSCSVAASALTIALKQNDGSTNASADNPVVIGFRSATATSGAYNRRTVTGSLSIVIPSGASLGHTSAVDQYVWVYAMDNAGTVELAVSGVNVFPDKSIASSTTIGAGSTSGTVLYSTTGRSNLPIRLIGRLLVNEATAGTWASAPSDVVIAPNPSPNVTDWVSFSPTIAGFGTPVNPNFLSRRVGDTLEVQGNFNAGTVSGAAASITIGFNGSNANVSLNNSKMGLTAGRGASSATASATYFGNFNVFYAGSGNILSMGYRSSTAVESGAAVGNALANTGAQISIQFSVPILGWSTYGP